MIAHSSVDEIIISEMIKKELKIVSSNLANAAKEFNAAQLKCDKLRQFRQDYVDRVNNEMQQFIAEDTRKGFQDFFAKLDIEISKQQQVVDDLRSQLKIQRQLWQECQRKKISNELILQKKEIYALPM
ncbi:MAG: flagellar export protein FliJ [Methylophilaceae bacterium]